MNGELKRIAFFLNFNWSECFLMDVKKSFITHLLYAGSSEGFKLLGRNFNSEDVTPCIISVCH